MAGERIIVECWHPADEPDLAPPDETEALWCTACVALDIRPHRRLAVMAAEPGVLYWAYLGATAAQVYELQEWLDEHGPLPIAHRIEAIDPKRRELW